MNNKKVLLIISSIVALGLVVIGIFGTYRVCNDNETCVNILHQFFLHFLPIIPLFIFALITYKMRDDVYQTWLRFAYVWIPLSMVLIFLAPEYAASFLYPITKGSTAFISSLLFILISLILVIWKYFVARKRVK